MKWYDVPAKYTDAEAVDAIEDSGGIDIEGINPVMIAVHATNQPTKDAKLGVVLAGGNSYPGIWFGQAAPSATNFAFLGNVASNGSLFNSPAGGYMAFRIGGANKMKIYPSGGVAIGDSFYSTDPGVDKVTIEQRLGIRTTAPTQPLDIDGNKIRLRLTATPATAGAAGNQGDFCWDADYFYVCVATDTWERTPHAWDTFKFDAIVENTADNGVNVETVNIKDGHINELQKLIFKDPSQLTISGGAVTATQSRHTIYTEGGDATDNLDTINGGEEGEMLIINASSSIRDVVVKHMTGNISLYGAGDITLDNARKMMMLVYHESYWCGF